MWMCVCVRVAVQRCSAQRGCRTFLPASEVVLAPDLSISDSCSNTSLRTHRTSVLQPTHVMPFDMNTHKHVLQQNLVRCSVITRHRKQKQPFLYITKKTIYIEEAGQDLEVSLWTQTLTKKTPPVILPTHLCM